MASLDPVTRLYRDLTSILGSLVIKYPEEAEANETVISKAEGNRYVLAYYMRDNYNLYEYSYEDYVALGLSNPAEIRTHMSNPMLLDDARKAALLEIRRARELREYVDKNDYYRMLYGYPDVTDTNFFYVTPELSDRLSIPINMPIHLIADKMGTYYISQLQATGYVDELIAAHPDKKYLNFLGTKRIPIAVSRPAKSFSILSIKQEEITESTYRTFIDLYERCRNYFMSVIYVYQYRKVIPYYDNFIALCIFIMTVQHVSMEGIRNAMDRQFYDEFMVRLLYDTYGIPFYSTADEATQKLICQNINMLVQNKATDKVFLNIASLLGFNEITIYQYYLVRQRIFDENGRPIFAKKKQINLATGKEEEVYDTGKMYDVHFQKVDITETNVKESLTDGLKRVDYYDITYYDPLWWEDDDLHHEIWDTAYNYMETKYYGATVPYRMTELLLQSIVLIRAIKSKQADILDVGINIPKITDKEVSLPTVVVLFLAIASKKFNIPGTITSVPSKLIHVLQVTDQVINKENKDNECLQFDFGAFDAKNVTKTMNILSKFLKRREYKIVNGHDVDLNPDGTPNKYAPTKKVGFNLNTDDLKELEGYISKLTIPLGSKKDKINALNKMYENIEGMYYFLSYNMSHTTDMDEYDALKKFYDTAFYTRETAEAYKVVDEDGVTRCAETFDEYLYYTDTELWRFVQDCPVDKTYEYLEHIIYKIEEFIPHVNYLYIANEDSSPLAELLDILLKFFKSYLIDFTQMTSLMVIDWDMENTFRLFDRTEYVHKDARLKEIFSKGFMDGIHRFTVKMGVDYEIKIKELLHTKGKYFLEDKMKFSDELMTDDIKRKTTAEDKISFTDEVYQYVVPREDRDAEEDSMLTDALDEGMVTSKTYIDDSMIFSDELILYRIHEYKTLEDDGLGFNDERTGRQEIEIRHNFDDPDMLTLSDELIKVEN